MKIVKRIIAGLLITAILVGAVTGGLYYIKKQNVKEVMVTSVNNIASEYYASETSIEGTVTTNISQNVTVDSDTIVKNVFVSAGDRVKIGDKLLEFDMTLVEMEYNIEKLKYQKLEQDLATAKRRLTSLKNGGPIAETDTNSYESSGTSSGTEDEDTASADMNKGMTLAAIMHPQLLLAAFTGGDILDDIYEGDVQGQESEDNESNGNGYSVNYQDPSAGDFTSGDNTFSSGVTVTPIPTETPQVTPLPTIDPESDIRPFEDEIVNGSSEFIDGNPVFYQVLDEDSFPFMGTGTKEDPYVFLCSSATGYVTAKGTFFNKMAGYSADGSKVEKEGGSWFLLEFYPNDTIIDFSNRKASCSGYYIIDGSLLLHPVDLEVEMEFSKDEALHYDNEENENNEEGEVTPDNGGGQAPLSRKEAIKEQEKRIKDLELDIREAELALKKIEKKLNRQTVYSKMDGIIAYVGDAVTGATTEDAFLKVKSEDGYFIKGSVSELLLDQIKEGTVLNCMSYESGAFKAKVIDISDYPTSSDSMWTDGNPNVSYYTYSADIVDDEIELQEYDWITVTLPGTTGDNAPLVIMKGFVISENGSSYVYKDENGILKKQQVILGEITDGGYNVIVKSGLSREDKVAFPYGKTVKEGAVTREVSLDEMYGY